MQAVKLAVRQAVEDVVKLAMRKAVEGVEARLGVCALVAEDVLQQALHSLPRQGGCVSLCHAPSLSLGGGSRARYNL